MHAVTEFPRRHRLSVDDFYRMAEVGILADDVRVELVDGEIIDMAPPGPLHASAVTRMTELFIHAVSGRATVLTQNPVRISKYSEPQPDLALLRPREDYYSTQHPLPADVLLVVEIADSSLTFDRDTKAPLYAQHEIPELWLVDLRGKRLVRYRIPDQGAYSRVDEPDTGNALTVSALPGISIELAGLFR